MDRGRPGLLRDLKSARTSGCRLKGGEWRRNPAEHEDAFLDLIFADSAQCLPLLRHEALPVWAAPEAFACSLWVKSKNPACKRG